jgi:hypothetical protein
MSRPIALHKTSTAHAEVNSPALGLNAFTAFALRSGGYTSVAAIELAPDAALLALKGIGPETLAEIRRQTTTYRESQDLAHRLYQSAGCRLIAI